MTTTIASDLTSIDITSGIFDNSNTAVTLTVTHNCTTTYEVIDLWAQEYGGTNSIFPLTPSDLGLTDDTFPDGVYYLLLTVTDGTLNVVTDAKCILVDNTLTCDMTDTFNTLNSDPNQIIKALSYHALKVADASCTSCSCTDWCLLYSAATEIDCANDSPCGCN